MILRPPKGVLKRSTHNPNAWVAQNYSIVEDLAQAPCAMSALEVIQSCPTQRKALLSAIGAVSSISEILNLDLDDCKLRLPHYAAIKMKVLSRGTCIL
jgi:hypothetical protein